jgi:hypothetical protein
MADCTANYRPGLLSERAPNKMRNKAIVRQKKGKIKRLNRKAMGHMNIKYSSSKQNIFVCIMTMIFLP